MSDEIPYSYIDRLLHNLAFGRNGVQALLSDIEGSMFGAHWKNLEVKQPIFITSLPRAGTTILLEILSKVPCCVTHTYRDMPFILSPYLWDKVSSRFRTTSRRKERAHGDGLMITEDSPEAFEEIIWKRFYPNKYGRRHIELWGRSDFDTPFYQFFYEHIQKLMSVSKNSELADLRYISKNNANIGRIELIQNYFPDSHILIPFRDPVSHAVSMHRQHVNFSAKHTDNKFAENYMRDIGHFEFGRLHRPLAFDTRNGEDKSFDLNNLEYWLDYWYRVFSYVVSLEGVTCISLENLTLARCAELQLLTANLGLKVGEARLDQLVEMLNPVKKYEYTGEERHSDLVDKCNEIYDRLKTKCILK